MLVQCFKEIIQFKQINSYPKLDMYHPFYLKDTDWKFFIQYNFLNRSIENRDPLHRRLAHRKTNSISDIVMQKFLMTRSISLKKNWIQLPVKKKNKTKKHKKAYMESKTVMLINSVLMTTLILLYVKI